MNKTKEYLIPFIGLKLGKHHFEYQISNAFFEIFDYNEYQDSGLIPLTVGRNSNLRRKFRDWNAILPRNQGSRERIRNPWIKLLLQFDNTSNYKLILHDISISYSV